MAYSSSTQDALLCITHDWFKQADMRISTVAVFFDLSKAFDRVSHSRLLYYLHKIGITGPLHKWFSDYLSARKQRVVLNGESSTFKDASSAWSSPGFYPRSFIILYLHEWAFYVPLSPGTKLALYADDIVLYKPLSYSEGLSDFQQDIQAISNWIMENDLSINHSKTKALVISRLLSVTSSSANLVMCT